MIRLVGCDDGADTAILNAESPYVHPLATNAHATITKNAARAVEIDDGRPLLLFAMVFRLGVLGFGSTVGESHVLQFAFAAGIAHGAIERMVAKQQLNHRLARLTYFIAIGGDDHALRYDGRAGGLELGHLLDFDDAH